jgi:GMP synthase-like glutamine amidotransferase
LRIGILQTGAPPEALQPSFGDYPAMFRDLLGPGYAYETFDVRAGQLPAPERCGAYVITGGAAGVYDELPWIAPTLDWLRDAKGRTRLVGICLGHQLMAEAFGGKVIKSPKGWGVGLHRYEVARPEPWMDGVQTFALPASHQDQVVEQPPATEVVASNAHTPFGMLAWTDQPAISIQLHPEFAPDYASALIESRAEERLTRDQADAALESLKQPNDRERVAGWIRGFVASPSPLAGEGPGEAGG